MYSVETKRLFLSRCHTCRRADAWRTFVARDGFKRRIQFQDELVEILQGDVELVVLMVTAGVREARMLAGCPLRRVHVDSLTHSQDMIGYHVGHAFGCRNHDRKPHSLQAGVEWREISYTPSSLSALQNRSIISSFSQESNIVLESDAIQYTTHVHLLYIAFFLVVLC